MQTIFWLGMHLQNIVGRSFSPRSIMRPSWPESPHRLSKAVANARPQPRIGLPISRFDLLRDPFQHHMSLVVHISNHRPSRRVYMRSLGERFMFQD